MKTYDTPLIARKMFNRWFFYPMLNHGIPRFVLSPILKRSHSPIVKESFKNPGSWRVMNLCYEKEKGYGWIHALFRESTLAMGLRNRKKLVVSNLKRLFESVPKKQLCVLGIGTGPALSIMESMHQSSLKSIKAYCVDLDDSAFEFGEKLKDKLGLNGKVEFIRSDVRHAMNKIGEEPNIIEIVGLFEYLDDNHLKQLCDFAFETLPSGGLLMANSVQPNHGVRSFLEKVFGLKLFYRDEEMLIKFMEKSGFRTFRVEREPLRIYSLIMAEKR